MLWDKVDSVIIPNFHNYWKHPLVNKYLNTKRRSSPSEQYEGILILRNNKRPLWISHPFNHAQAKKTIRGATLLTYQTRKELKHIITTYCGKRIGFDARHMAVSTLHSFNKISNKKFIDVAKELEELREIKTPEEINRLARAVHATRKALTKIIKNMKVGDTEEELELKLKNEFEFNGMETAFCIVAFGKNTAHIHHVSTHKKLTNNTPVLIDVGAKYKGYCADLSDSFWFGTKEPKAYTLAYKKVAQCLKNVEKKLTIGTSAQELWNETTMLGKIPHALGHGIGIEEHDFPSAIGENTTWKLLENEVVAIEPAIYTKQFGIRLEEDYVITKKNARRL